MSKVHIPERSESSSLINIIILMETMDMDFLFANRFMMFKHPDNNLSKNYEICYLSVHAIDFSMLCTGIYLIEESLTNERNKP